MKWILNGYCFFAFAGTSLFAGEENALESACGFLCLTTEQVEGLESWKEPKKAFIGCHAGRSSHEAGLIVQNGSLHHEDLTNIAFEEEDCFRSQKFIVEHSVRSIGMKQVSTPP